MANWINTIGLFWVLLAGCQLKQTQISHKQQDKTPNPNKSSQILAPSDTSGDFLGKAQTTPPALQAILANTKAVIFKDGTQRLCLTQPGPPCTGKVVLDSGKVEPLGTSFVCRFSSEGENLVIKVVDLADSTVFSATFPLPKPSQVTQAGSEITSGNIKFSVISACSL